MSFRSVMFFTKVWWKNVKVYPTSLSMYLYSSKLSNLGSAPFHPKAATHMEREHSVSMGQSCQGWISEHLTPYLGTLEPCVDMHRTVSYIAWSYWGQERSGGTEALQMFFISGPQGKSVTTTPGSFCSELGGRAVMLCHSPAIWLKRDHSRIVRDPLFTWTVHGNFSNNLFY